MYQWFGRIFRWWRWLLAWLFPTSDVFYVNGRYLYDNCRSKVVLRGINLPWNCTTTRAKATLNS